MMKTSKEKTTPKTKKASETVEAGSKKKVAAKKYEPSVEEIRAKAEEIYFKRISTGEHGTEESDWLKAEESLRKLKK
jgi:hypothetical protein